MMRAGLIAIGVAVAVLLSGCSDNLFGMCPTHFPGATWHEQGIYGRLAGIGEEEDPDTELPFNHPSKTGHLSAVVWTPEPGDAVWRIELDPTPEDAFPPIPEGGSRGLSGPTVTLMVENAASTKTVESAFAYFLQGVTSAPSERILDWSSVGARQSEGEGDDDVREHRVSVSGPFRLEALYNETGARPGATDLSSGFEWHKGGNWGFRFQFSERSGTLPNAVTFTADSRDIVSVLVPGEPLTTNATLAKIKQGFGDVGIEVVGPRADQFTMAQC